MIRIGHLRQLLSAEIAADKWWDGLSKKEQKAYIKAHPRSKYAKQASAPSRGGKFASAIAHHSAKAKGAKVPRLSSEEHSNLSKYHRKFLKRMPVDNPEYSRHAVMQEYHERRAQGKPTRVADWTDHEWAAKHYASGGKSQKPSYISEKDRKAGPPDTVPKPNKGAIHSGTRAVAASNHLVKNFGAKRHKNFSSNKYSEHQAFDHTISAAGAKKMHQHLIDNGWKVEESPAKEYYARKESVVGTHRSYKHPDGGHIEYTHKLGAHTNSGKDYHHVTVWGKKRAKPTNLPYYD